MSTSSPPLIPPSFYFRPALRCPRVEDIPKAKGRPLALPEGCVLPNVGEIDGRAPWAEVRAAWNEGGLAVAVEVRGKQEPVVHREDRPDESDGVQLWIDTRDTRDIHRASRHCHRFVVGVVPAPGGKLDVIVAQWKIHRATADAPTASLGRARAWAEATEGGYRLELFLPGLALHGFDPETNRRLGFTYRVIDPERGDQWLSVGPGFPVAEDPSLWATLELVGDA